MFRRAPRHGDYSDIILEIWADGRTLMSPQKLMELAEVAKKINSEGCVAELGVYKGGSAALLANIFKSKKIYLFDTFNGMPETDELKPEVGGHSKGDFNDAPMEYVMEYLSPFYNCVFMPGFFPETAEVIKNEKFCFVHLDGDIYQSTKAGVDFFYPRLVDGGIIFFDDYSHEATPGVTKIVDEYFEDDERARVTKFETVAFVQKK